MTQPEVVMRRYAYRLYPNAGQDAALHEQRRLHGALWNAIHEISETQYRRTGKRPSAYDLIKQIKDLRRECPEYGAIGSTALGLTIKRYDTAWKAYFRRFKEWRGGGSDKPPGPPSYRSTERYPGFDLSYTSNGTPGHWGGSGWRFDFGAGDRRNGCRHGRVYIMGIAGLIKARGRMPVGFERIKTGTVRWTGVHWELSLAVEMQPRREAGAARLTVEMNLIDEFARVTVSDGRCAPGPEADSTSGNGQISPQSQGDSDTAGSDSGDLGSDRRAQEDVVPRGEGSDSGDLGSDRRTGPSPALGPSGSDSGDPGAERRERRSFASSHCGDDLQRSLSRCKRGSCRWRERRRRLAALSAKVARRRAHELHALSSTIVDLGRQITLVRPPAIKDITASAVGSVTRPGVMVGTKAEANRAILSQAPAAFISMLEYKAAEAGAALNVIEAPNAPAVLPSRLVDAANAVKRARGTLYRKEKQT